MTERWQQEFNPSTYLDRMDIQRFLRHHEPDVESRIGRLESACILCKTQTGGGVRLNDNSCLCIACLEEISQVAYPEKYERRKRAYLKSRESHYQARKLFESSRISKKLAVAEFIGGVICALVAISVTEFVFVAILSFGIAAVARRKYLSDLTSWDLRHPIPAVPELRHFYDPDAVLSERDRAVLGVFEHWLGTPPHWEYVRSLVLERDNNRCQVNGCPSRLTLHVHHIMAKSNGGAHSLDNLVALCEFHHALEASGGHQRIWPTVQTQYFTMVREHDRRDRFGDGTHVVHAHLRRLELITVEELRVLHGYYGFACQDCDDSRLQYTIYTASNTIGVVCTDCSKQSTVPRQLTEETGPLLAEVLRVRRNAGTRVMRWDVLDQRTNRSKGESDS